MQMAVTYTILCTRQYISFTIEMVSQFKSNSGLAYWQTIKRTFKYFCGTSNFVVYIVAEIYIEGYHDTIGPMIKMNVSSPQTTQFYQEMEQFHGVAINNLLLLLPRIASKHIACSIECKRLFIRGDSFSAYMLRLYVTFQSIVTI